MARMLGRFGWHLRGHSGQHPCGECNSGHYIDRRARKRIENRQWKKEAAGEASMDLRQLGPDEPSVGLHMIEGLDEAGTVLARFECPCDWCVVWRAAKPEMDRAVELIEQELGLA